VPRRLAAAALLLVAAAGAALLLRGGPDSPERAWREAERILRERFQRARARVERAAEEVEALALAPHGEAERFTLAESIRADAEIDGVVVLDRGNVARFWGGRTFDVAPLADFPSVWRGFSETGVLERPAQRVLYAARPAGPSEAAIAFLVIEERFPGGADLADEVAEASGLASIRLRYGEGTVPATADPALERTCVIDGLVHVTMRALSPEERAFAARVRGHRLRFLLLALVGAGAALGLWLRVGRKMPKGSAPRVLLAILLLAALRLLLPRPLWDRPWHAAATALALLLAGATLARSLRRPDRHLSRLVAGSLALLAAALLARAYLRFLPDLARMEEDLFDPRRVPPGPGAAGALAAAAFATGAFFLLARAAQRVAGPLAFLAIALGAFSPAGALLALLCLVASVALDRAGSRPERATALAFLAAIATFPVLFPAWREERVARIAARTERFLAPGRADEMRDLLARAAAAVTDPETGIDREIAARVASDGETSHLAFRLFGAADWRAEEACAVQVWDASSRLLSAFDFDSPPSRWLLEPPEKEASGFRPYFVELEKARIRYYAQDIPLRPIGEERVVGVARFLVPDRWDALLSRARPSIFSEPLTRLVGAGTPPFLLAQLDRGGRVVGSSADAALGEIPGAMLDEASRAGYSEGPVVCRGAEASLLLVPESEGFAALVFRPLALEQALLAFSKIVLVAAALCLLYVLLLLVRLRGRPLFLFRHRVALALVLLIVPPVLFLAIYNHRVQEERYEAEISDRMQRRLDLAETLLRKEPVKADNAWCANFASDHRSDLNLYERGELFATSRPGVWDTGMLGRRLPASVHVALAHGGSLDATALVHFGRPGGLRVAYRVVRGGWGGEPAVAAAPALEDRRELERRGAESNALLLSAYLLTATTTIFFALLLARSVTAPVGRLVAATRRVAEGDFAATLPQGGRDEFGQLIESFNRMTRELADAQELRVRAEKEAAWREMARQVAHEIKNPLTPIKLTIQNLLALETEDPAAFREEFRGGAGRILEQIEALRRIANEFSAYGRFPSRELAVVDLDALLADVAALYASTGDVEKAASSAPLAVRADKDELRRALINLVTNARQAGAKRILLRADAEPRCARVEVRDDGAGIPPELLPRLFEPAFTTKTSGTGLGLAIVKRIITDLGGSISIDSAPGRGTTVVLRLPRAP